MKLYFLLEQGGFSIYFTLKTALNALEIIKLLNFLKLFSQFGHQRVFKMVQK